MGGKLACESGLVAVLLTEIGDWDEEIFKQIKYLRARGRRDIRLCRVIRLVYIELGLIGKHICDRRIRYQHLAL
jgi:hypothetical protein